MIHVIKTGETFAYSTLVIEELRLDVDRYLNGGRVNLIDYTIRIGDKVFKIKPRDLLDPARMDRKLEAQFGPPMEPGDVWRP